MPNLALPSKQIDKWANVLKVDYPISIYIGFIHKGTSSKQLDKGRDIREVDDFILVHIAQQKPVQEGFLINNQELVRRNHADVSYPTICPLDCHRDLTRVPHTKHLVIAAGAGSITKSAANLSGKLFWSTVAVNINRNDYSRA